MTWTENGGELLFVLFSVFVKKITFEILNEWTVLSVLPEVVVRIGM